MSIIKGALYVVATPLGNLADITARALDVLRAVDVIAAEDTRHSRTLITHFGLDTPLMSLHEHNEHAAMAAVLQRLSAGDAVALISDAGTPLISDPGFPLVRAAREQGYAVIPVPGACAAIAALSVGGLPTDRFVFEGFLPAKSQARVTRLAELQRETRTLVFYESTHRISAVLADMATAFGTTRQAVVAREMTKLYEDIRSGDLGDLAMHYADSVHCKGEFVVLIAGAAAQQADDFARAEEILIALLEDLPVKKAVTLTARLTAVGKNWLYDRALQLKNK